MKDISIKYHFKTVSVGLAIFLVAGTTMAEDLDIKIQGQHRDQVEIKRVVPDPDVPIKDVIPFSRLGQTDWILSEELNYVDNEKQIALMDVRSPKTYDPSMIEFPKPPFFVQSYPPPPEPIIVDRSPDAGPIPGENESWTFLVVDQKNNLLKKIEGTTTPTDPITWDGMDRGKFMLKPDEIYSSMLIIQESPTQHRNIPGDPIWLPALRYIEGNQIKFEFSNRRVYQDGNAQFSPTLHVYVDQLMNELRKHEGAPFTITIFDRNLDLGQQRARTWKQELEKNLLIDADKFNVRVSLPQDRGEITQVVLSITK